MCSPIAAMATTSGWMRKLSAIWLAMWTSLTGPSAPGLLGRMGRLAADAPPRHAGLAVPLLPVGQTVGAPDLHRRHLVFRAVGRPVAVVGGDDVGPGHRMMKGRIDDTGLHPLGDARVEGNLPRSAGQGHQVVVPHPPRLRVERMDLQNVFLMPDIVGGSPRLLADIILAK